MDASEVLQDLSKQYPKEKIVWEYLAETSFQAGDMKLYQKACEDLCKLAPRKGEWAYQLGGAYLNNQHPLMARQTFLKVIEPTFSRFARLVNNYEIVPPPISRCPPLKRLMFTI